MVPGSIESRSQKVSALLHKTDTVIVGGGQGRSDHQFQPADVLTRHEWEMQLGDRLPDDPPHYVMEGRRHGL